MQFSLKIIEDVIKNFMYNKKDIYQVFNDHIEANRGRLDMGRMQKQIQKLCEKLNVTFIDILEDSVSECVCSSNYKNAVKKYKDCIRSSNCLENIEKLDYLEDILNSHKEPTTVIGSTATSQNKPTTVIDNTITNTTHTEKCKSAEDVDILTLDYNKSLLFSDSTTVCVLPISSVDSEYLAFQCPPGSEELFQNNRQVSLKKPNILVIPYCCKKVENFTTSTNKTYSQDTSSVKNNSTKQISKQDETTICSKSSPISSVLEKPIYPEKKQITPCNILKSLEVTETTLLRVRGNNNEEFEHVLVPGPIYVPKSISEHKIPLHKSELIVPEPVLLKTDCSDTISTATGIEISTLQCSQITNSTSHTTTTVVSTSQTPQNFTQNDMNIICMVEEKMSSVLSTINYSQQSLHRTCSKKSSIICSRFKSTHTKIESNQLEAPANISQFFPDKATQTDLLVDEEIYEWRYT